MMLAATALVMAGCSQKVTTTSSDNVIGKPTVTVEDGRFTPELMWQLGQMGNATVSPDGSRVAYTVKYISMEQNKGNADIYVMNVDGSDVKRFTETETSEGNLVWQNDNTLMYIRGNQILSKSLDGKNETVVAEREGGFEGFKLAPDGKSMIYIATIPVERPENINKSPLGSMG